jgi:opacity protein-like surface antigen
MRRLLLAAMLAASCASAASAADEKEGVVTAIMAAADRLDLLPGQSILFTPDRGKMTMILFTEGKWEPDDGQIKLEFTSAGEQASLVVTNKSDQPFRYKAEILKELGAKKGKATSTCTLIPGIMAFEQWPHSIAALRVSDFAPAPDGEMVCR